MGFACHLHSFIHSYHSNHSIHSCYCRRKSSKSNFRFPNPIVSKTTHNVYCNLSLEQRLLSLNMSEIEMNSGKLQQHGRVFSDQLSCNKASGRIRNGNVMELGPVSVRWQMVKDVWGGNKFSLKELEVAANGHSKQNLIDKGDYGVVYHGILSDNTCAAVKRLVSDRFQVEDFTAAIVRHKNLDKLLGYRIERVYRLAYLHEDIEQKILRRSIISSNVLLDHQWDPKVSDFGLAKLYSPEWGINIMESLRCIPPEYASTGDFTEKSDIYSFGVLVMEIITGRSPTDRSLPYLVDWLESMVAGQKIDCVVDPKMPEKPSSEELKRVLLVALRCVDPDSEHRPRLGEVIHMLELRGLLLCDLGTRSMAEETNFFSFYLPRRERLQDQVIGSLEKQKCKAAAKSLQENRVEVKTVILKLR